ncbi:Guanosine-diphosphatase [Marasmius crinis-equi]|uniref:Guanosine-diphosphatase n=1 Tax=Marasmius crinis-equi TaxID=585013 RepID=A0ABR3ESW7_9AGAR
MSLFAPERKYGKEEVCGNPCTAKGMERKVELEDVKTGKERTVTMVREQIGSFQACSRVVELALVKDAMRKLDCSLNVVYQSSRLNTFPTWKVLS